jgi:Fibronectin type III domain
VWKPAAPAGLTAAPGGQAGEVTLTWNAPASHGQEISDYHIEQSSDGVTWTTVADDVSTATTFTVGELTGETNYAFRVAAENAIGVGPASDVASAAPLWTPAAPGELTARVAPAAGVASGEVDLSWAAAAGNGADVTDYVIESSTDGLTWATVDDGESAATTATVAGLSNGTRYRFRVAAVNVAGVGPASAETAATPTGAPAAPAGLRAAVAPTPRVLSGQVRLTWSAPSNAGLVITDYVIQRSLDGTTWRTVEEGVSRSASRIVSGLANGRAYQFRVAAKNAVGLGAWSTAIEATPRWKPAAPRFVRARPGVRSGQVRLTWNAPSDRGAPIRDYVIQRLVGGTTWRTVNDGVSTNTTRILGGLTDGTRHRFRVAAKNAVGRGPWSATVLVILRSR